MKTISISYVNIIHSVFNNEYPLITLTLTLTNIYEEIIFGRSDWQTTFQVKNIFFAHHFRYFALDRPQCVCVFENTLWANVCRNSINIFNVLLTLQNLHFLRYNVKNGCLQNIYSGSKNTFVVFGVIFPTKIGLPDLNV